MKTRKKLLNLQNNVKLNGFTFTLSRRRIGDNKTATVFRQLNGRQLNNPYYYYHYRYHIHSTAFLKKKKFYKFFVENSFSFNVTSIRNVKLRRRSCYRQCRRRQNTQNNYVYDVNAT